MSYGEALGYAYGALLQKGYDPDSIFAEMGMRVTRIPKKRTLWEEILHRMGVSVDDLQSFWGFRQRGLGN
jgi:hypothetical protein